MTLLIADVEANGLTPDTIHCLVVKEVDTGDILIFRDGDKHLFKLWLATKKNVIWVFHNGLGYDVDVLNKLWDADINPFKVVDTMVVSKTKNFIKYRPHSLDKLGEIVGVPKTEYNGGWDEWSQEMEDYCIDDVKTTEAVFDYFRDFISDPSNADALRLEHDTAITCAQMGEEGFPFYRDKAKRLLSSVVGEMQEIEDRFKSDIPPSRHEVKRLKNRFKKNKDRPVVIEKAMAEYPDYEIVGDEIVFYDMKHFDPASSKQRIDMLWDAGWDPIDKTKGHILWEK